MANTAAQILLGGKFTKKTLGICQNTSTTYVKNCCSTV
jgi:hypothetical protein